MLAGDTAGPGGLVAMLEAGLKRAKALLEAEAAARKEEERRKAEEKKKEEEKRNREEEEKAAMVREAAAMQEFTRKVDSLVAMFGAEHAAVRAACDAEGRNLDGTRRAVSLVSLFSTRTFTDYLFTFVGTRPEAVSSTEGEAGRSYGGGRGGPATKNIRDARSVSGALICVAFMFPFALIKALLSFSF